VLLSHSILYLAMEVRTGKTLTSLNIAEKAGATSVLFVTDQFKFPPTLPEFKSLCRAYYVRPELPKLEHKLTPEDIERNKQRIAEIRASLGMRMASEVAE